MIWARNMWGRKRRRKESETKYRPPEWRQAGVRLSGWQFSYVWVEPVCLACTSTTWTHAEREMDSGWKRMEEKIVKASDTKALKSNSLIMNDIISNTFFSLLTRHTNTPTAMREKHDEFMELSSFHGDSLGFHFHALITHDAFLFRWCFFTTLCSLKIYPTTWRRRWRWRLFLCCDEFVNDFHLFAFLLLRFTQKRFCVFV